MKLFLKIFFFITIITWPFTALFFGFQYGFEKGLALGSVSSLIAGLTLAHIIEWAFSLYHSQKSRKKD